MSSRRTLAERALAVLNRNDTGRFFRPAPHVYPFQWNWDSAMVALGLARRDPARGRREVRSLLEGRWADGMVPHIVLHPQPVDYSPGPELWRSEVYEGAPGVATSVLTQPPVLATAVRALHEADPDRAFLEEVVPEIDEWHRWFYRARSLDGSGLVSILHPWESADNSPRFDAALERVDVADTGEVRRTDKALLDADERPTDLEYRRYLALLAALDRVGYRPSSPAETPFAYLDLPLNSILCVAEEDLGLLWKELGDDGAHAREAATALRTALSRCWEEERRRIGSATCTARTRSPRRSPTCSRSMPACRTAPRRAAWSTSGSGRLSVSAPPLERRGR